MFEHFLLFLQEVIVPIGPLGVFLASVIEEVIAPIPSAAVLFLSGFLFLYGLDVNAAFFGTLILKIALPAILGMALGSLFIYGLAYHLGKPFFEKFGKYIGVLWEDIEKTRASFQTSSRDEITLFIVRALPIVPSVIISATCGTIRMKVGRYLVVTMLGLIPRVFVLSFLGFLAGDLYGEYAELISRYEDYVLYGAIFLTLVFILYRIFRLKQAK